MELELLAVSDSEGVGLARLRSGRPCSGITASGARGGNGAEETG